MLIALNHTEQPNEISHGYLRAKSTLLLKTKQYDDALDLMVGALNHDYYEVDWAWALLGKSLVKLEPHLAIACCARAWLMEVALIPEDPQGLMLKWLSKHGFPGCCATCNRDFAWEVESLAEEVLLDFSSSRMAA